MNPSTENPPQNHTQTHPDRGLMVPLCAKRRRRGGLGPFGHAQVVRGPPHHIPAEGPVRSSRSINPSPSTMMAPWGFTPFSHPCTVIGWRGAGSQEPRYDWVSANHSLEGSRLLRGAPANPGSSPAEHLLRAPRGVGPRVRRDGGAAPLPGSHSAAPPPASARPRSRQSPICVAVGAPCRLGTQT